jgi:hypothetical protein
MARRAPKEGLHRHPPAALAGDEAGGGGLFGPEEQALVSALLPAVEQLVGEHFHLTSFGLAGRCYEVVTRKVADADGAAPFALAKLCRYDRRERRIREGKALSHFYRIYLQDGNLLERARSGPGLSLRALLLYVLAHELVHVVRFESFQVHHGAVGAARDREEEAVHGLTREVLAPLRDPEVERVVRAMSHGGVDVLE